MGRARPTKAMMVAVNAAIDGEHDQVDKLVEEHDLDRKELQERLMLRNGDKYELRKRKPRRKTGASPAAVRTRSTVDIDITINGRTSVKQLFRIIEQADQLRAQAQQELKRRPQKDIDLVKKAMSEIELLRRERQKLERKIQEAEDSLW